MKKNTFTKLLLTSAVVLPSDVVFAKKYDNHYLNYVYDNYLNKSQQPTVADIQVKNNTNKNLIIEVNIKEEESKDNKIIIAQENNAVPQNKEVATEEIVEELAITTENKVLTKENETKKSQSKAVKKDKKTPLPLYWGLGLGISNLGDFEVAQVQYSEERASMEPQEATNFYIKFGLPDLILNQMDLEFELGYVENDKITTPHENGVYLIEYNQNMKTYNLGANLNYNFDLDMDLPIVPYLGFGLGLARVELSDYGMVDNGSLIPFESASESKNTFYSKFSAGISYDIDKKSTLVIGTDYIIYNDIDYKFLDLEDLSRFNVSAGLRFYF